MKSDRENNRNINKKIKENSVFETNKLLSTVVAVMLITTAFMIGISPSIKAASEDNLLSNEFFEEWNDIPKYWSWNGAFGNIRQDDTEPLLGNYNVELIPVEDHKRLDADEVSGEFNGHYYGAAWVKGTDGVKARIGIVAPGWSYGDYVELEDNEWTKVSHGRDVTDQSEIKMIISVLESDAGDQSPIYVGAAWLGSQEPPKDWLGPEYHTYQFNIEDLASCYEVEEALVDPVDADFDGMTPVKLSIAIDVEKDMPYDGMVWVNPVGADDLQLWAKDTGDVWHDVNVAGWGPSDGFLIDLDAVTEIFVIATDFFGDQDVTLELVDVTGEYSATDSIIISQVETVTACETIVEWELIISSTVGGSVIEPGIGMFMYDDGMVVDLEAVADTGYHFVEWTGDIGTIADPSEPVTTIEMFDDYTIEAVFAEDIVIEWELIISSTVGGTVIEPGIGMFMYDYGMVVDLVAEADPGYHFVEWMGDTGQIDDVYAAETNTTMLGDYEVTAVFAIDEHDLTITCSPGWNLFSVDYFIDMEKSVPYGDEPERVFTYINGAWVGGSNLESKELALSHLSPLTAVYVKVAEGEESILGIIYEEDEGLFPPEEKTDTQHLKPGWNLISVPVDGKAGTLLNTLIQGSLVNLYDQEYIDTGDIPDYDLEATKGYWVNMNTAHTFTLIVPPLPD